MTFACSSWICACFSMSPSSARQPGHSGSISAASSSITRPSYPIRLPLSHHPGLDHARANTPILATPLNAYPTFERVEDPRGLVGVGVGGEPRDAGPARHEVHPPVRVDPDALIA